MGVRRFSAGFGEVRGTAGALGLSTPVYTVFTLPDLNPLEFQTLAAYRCASLCLSVVADTHQAAGDRPYVSGGHVSSY